MNKIQLDPRIFIIEDFLTPKECSDYIEKSELQSFEEAKVNMGGTQVMLKGVRNNDRLLFFDENLAETLWSKI